MAKFLDTMREKIRVKHYSYKTEKTYVDWAERYIRFHKLRHPAEMGRDEVESFLTHLAVDRQVSSSTQNQALHALLFMYEHVVGKKLEHVEPMRAKKSVHVPAVLSQDEVKKVLGRLNGVYYIIGRLLYGSGMRLMECMRLRVKDVNFDLRTVTVRDTKSDRDRVTVLPASIVEPLRAHLKRVQLQHEEDMRVGRGSVEMPSALARKYPNAEFEWGWQYVFPASKFSADPRSGVPKHPPLVTQTVRLLRARS